MLDARVSLSCDDKGLIREGPLKLHYIEGIHPTGHHAGFEYPKQLFYRYSRTGADPTLRLETSHTHTTDLKRLDRLEALTLHDLMCQTSHPHSQGKYKLLTFSSKSEGLGSRCAHSLGIRLCRHLRMDRTPWTQDGARHKPV